MIIAIAILAVVLVRRPGTAGPTRPGQSGAVGSIAVGGSGAAIGSPTTSGALPKDDGFLVSLAELRARAERGRAGVQPEAAGLDDLLAWAREEVNHRPDPSEPLRIKGTTGPFVDDTATAYGLALAWGATGDAAYATASRDHVMAWVDTTRTLVRACPTGGDCQTSLIVGRTAAGFVFAMELLRDSGAISPADDAAFRTWLATVILPSVSERPNNWGDAGDLLRVSATSYLGDAAGFDAAIAFWRSQIDLIAPDGHIPEEVRRGSSGLSYTQEALMYKVAVARIAERHGIDLWSTAGSGGGSLKGAVDLAATSLTDPKDWQWAGNVTVPTTGPVWELVYAHWPSPTVAALLRQVRPMGWDGHSAVRWTTFTNGVPLGG